MISDFITFYFLFIKSKPRSLEFFFASAGSWKKTIKKMLPFKISLCNLLPAWSTYGNLHVLMHYVQFYVWAFTGRIPRVLTMLLLGYCFPELTDTHINFWCSRFNLLYGGQGEQLNVYSFGLMACESKIYIQLNEHQILWIWRPAVIFRHQQTTKGKLPLSPDYKAPCLWGTQFDGKKSSTPFYWEMYSAISPKSIFWTISRNLN